MFVRDHYTVPSHTKTRYERTNDVPSTHVQYNKMHTCGCAMWHKSAESVVELGNKSAHHHTSRGHVNVLTHMGAFFEHAHVDETPSFSIWNLKYNKITQVEMLKLNVFLFVSGHTYLLFLLDLFCAFSIFGIGIFVHHFNRRPNWNRISSPSGWV